MVRRYGKSVADSKADAAQWRGLAHPRLIFVEGNLGTGKSTTSQRICLAHKQHGKHARWYHEGALDPLFNVRSAKVLRSGRVVDLKRFKHSGKKIWRDGIEPSGVWRGCNILDGRLLHTEARTLFFEGAAADEIEAFVKQLIVPIKEKLLVVYLTRPDFRKAFFQLCRRRDPDGSGWTRDLMNRFAGTARFKATPGRDDLERLGKLFDDFGHFAVALLDRLDVKYIKVSADDLHVNVPLEVIYRKLRLSPPVLDEQPDDPSRYTGIYSLCNGAADHQLVVKQSGDGLVVDGFRWDAIKLLPWRGRFLLEGWPQELRFEHGEPQVLRVEGRRCLWGRQPGEVYTRI